MPVKCAPSRIVFTDGCRAPELMSGDTEQGAGAEPGIFIPHFRSPCFGIVINGPYLLHFLIITHPFFIYYY